MNWHWPDDEPTPTRSRDDLMAAVRQRGTTIRNRRRAVLGAGTLAALLVGVIGTVGVLSRTTDTRESTELAVGLGDADNDTAAAPGAATPTGSPTADGADPADVPAPTFGLNTDMILGTHFDLNTEMLADGAAAGPDGSAAPSGTGADAAPTAAAGGGGTSNQESAAPDCAPGECTNTPPTDAEPPDPGTDPGDCPVPAGPDTPVDDEPVIEDVPGASDDGSPGCIVDPTPGDPTDPPGPECEGADPSCSCDADGSCVSPPGCGDADDCDPLDCDDPSIWCDPPAPCDEPDCPQDPMPVLPDDDTTADDAAEEPAADPRSGR